MRFIDKLSSLFGREPAKMEHVGKAHLFNIPIAANQVLRRGMWVIHNGMIAILVDANQQGVAEIHYIAGDGTTTAVDHVQISGLRQATVKEIPESRRPKHAVANAFGYKEA